MTEAEWQESDNPRAMLTFLSDYLPGKKFSTRKLRLLACAVARLVWADLTDPRSRAAIEVAEKYVEGEADKRAVKTAHREANKAQASAYGTPNYLPSGVACHASHPADTSWALTSAVSAMSAPNSPIREPLAVLVRDVFNYPFRLVSLTPLWLTSTVVALTAGIYAERAFDRMPILADALEDAGCDHADILTHCRGDGPHIRGCWVVDLLLGKE